MEMTMPRSAETRLRIMDAAVARFSANGYDAASVEDICSEAGVSKGAFYYHFESKQTLFLGLLQAWLVGLDKAMNAARRPTVPETLIEMTKMLPVAMGEARHRLGMWLEFWSQASRDKAVWKATIAPYRHYREFFSQMINDGISEGTFREVDPDTAAQAILSMAVGLFLQSVLDPRGAKWQKTAEQSMQMLMSGLVTTKER
jgi:AcrR family transcriptional regulator